MGRLLVGGNSNPLEVMEQLTYLLFIKGLDEQQTLAENKANRKGKPVENPIFPDGDDRKGRPYSDCTKNKGTLWWRMFGSRVPAWTERGTFGGIVVEWPLQLVPCAFGVLITPPEPADRTHENAQG